MNDTLTITQVAGDLQVHRNTIHRLIATGQLVAIRVSGKAGGRGRHRIRRADLEAYKQSASAPLPPATKRVSTPVRRGVTPLGVARWDLDPVLRRKTS